MPPVLQCAWSSLCVLTECCCLCYSAHATAQAHKVSAQLLSSRCQASQVPTHMQDRQESNLVMSNKAARVKGTYACLAFVLLRARLPALAVSQQGRPSTRGDIKNLQKAPVCLSEQPALRAGVQQQRAH
eukprot:1162062-Pelagomonas_calceolata.AAC.19